MVTVKLTPHQALQFCRWKTYLTMAVNDPNSISEPHDRAGILDAIENVVTQSKQKLTIDQIEDGFAEQSVNKLIDKKYRI